MAIQYPNFQGDPTIRPDFSGLENLPKTFMQGMQIALLPKKMKQEEQQQELQNALLQQRALTSAQQGRLAGVQAEYYPQLTSANIEQKRADAQRAEQLANIYRQVFPSAGGQQISPQQQTIPNGSSMQMVGDQQQMQPSQGSIQQMPMQGENQQMMQPGVQQQQPEQQGWLSPQQKMALGLLKIDPSKVAPMEQQQYEASQLAKSQEEAKRGVGERYDYLNKMDDEQNNLIKQSTYFGSLIDKFSDPNFINAVGPINSIVQKYMPDEDAGQVKSELDALSGNLKQSIIQMGVKAPQAMGRFANEIKPSTNDTAISFYGKAIAGKAAKDWEIDYNKAQRKYIKQGLDPSEAAVKAADDVPFNDYLKKGEAVLSDSKAASKYKKYFPNQDVRTTKDSVEVSIPGSKQYVSPHDLEMHNGKLYVKVPGTNQIIPTENYDEALKRLGIK